MIAGDEVVAANSADNLQLFSCTATVYKKNSVFTEYGSATLGWEYNGVSAAADAYIIVPVCLLC